MSQVINLLSNAPTHIIEEIIKNNKNRLNNEDTKKKIINQIIPYVIIKNMDVSEIPILKKPNKEDVEELVEYQTFYSITLKNMANKKINDNLDESTKIINEKLYKFSEDEQGNVIMDKEVYDMKNEIRFKIYNMEKNQWNYYEDLIEEIHKRLNEKNVKKKEKNKVGRPARRKQNQNLNQITIDTYMKSIDKKEELMDEKEKRNRANTNNKEEAKEDNEKMDIEKSNKKEEVKDLEDKIDLVKKL